MPSRLAKTLKQNYQTSTASEWSDFTFDVASKFQADFALASSCSRIRAPLLLQGTVRGEIPPAGRKLSKTLESHRKLHVHDDVDAINCGLDKTDMGHGTIDLIILVSYISRNRLQFSDTQESCVGYAVSQECFARFISKAAGIDSFMNCPLQAYPARNMAGLPEVARWKFPKPSLK